jgi:multidrug resistance efflux pump
MSDVNLKSEPVPTSVAAGDIRPRESGSRKTVKPRIRIVPVLITLATVVVASLLGWRMWQEYMVAPWTRDGRVRAYTVTMAPEVAGRIVELPVADNQFV